MRASLIAACDVFEIHSFVHTIILIILRDSSSALLSCDIFDFQPPVYSPMKVARKDQAVLLFEQACHLESRHSRSHRFDLVRCVEDGGPPLDDSGNDGVGSGGSRLPLGCRALDLTVTITYKGEFSSRGYRLGRLAAHLSRLPPYTPKVGSLPFLHLPRLQYYISNTSLCICSVWSCISPVVFASPLSILPSFAIIVITISSRSFTLVLGGRRPSQERLRLQRRRVDHFCLRRC